MTDKEKLDNYEFVKKCVHYAWDKDLMEDFFFLWAGQEGTGPIEVSINCNDLFYWGRSDSQEVTEKNFHLLEEAYAEIAPLYEVPSFVDSGTLSILFCCKVREMRPQTPYYKHIDRKYWPLIDACGENREDQMDVEEYLKLKREQKMSLQKAIEILKDELIKIKIDFEYGTNTTKQFLKGYKQAVSVLEKVQSYQYTRQPSPDTDYKIALTKWIEAKQQSQNPYSIFEAWQKKAHDNVLGRSPYADFLEAEEGEA